MTMEKREKTPPVAGKGQGTVGSDAAHACEGHQSSLGEGVRDGRVCRAGASGSSSRGSKRRSNGQNAGRLRITVARRVVLALVTVAVLAGVEFHTGTGTPSSFGWGFISTICPMGALEALFGSWAFVPRLLIVLAVMVVAVFVVGSSFCAWACPVPPLRHLFATKKQRQRDVREQEEAAHVALANYKAAQAGADNSASAQEHLRPKRLQLDSRHGVLAVTLGATAIFGFPVFCVVCPIGLTFGIAVLFARLLGFGELSWGLLMFPLILVLELTVLRKWCTKICPVSALFSLISSRSKTLRPVVDRLRCARVAHGADCNACAKACPQLVDPHSNLGVRFQADCTRCGLCAESCPQGAISFPLLQKDAPAAEFDQPAPSQPDEAPAPAID